MRVGRGAAASNSKLLTPTGTGPTEAKPLVTGQGSVRTERRRRVTDTIQRIALAVSSGDESVQRGPLGGDATGVVSDAP